MVVGISDDDSIISFHIDCDSPWTPELAIIPSISAEVEQEPSSFIEHLHSMVAAINNDDVVVFVHSDSSWTVELAMA